MTNPAPATSTPEPVLKAAGLWGTLAAFVVTAIGVLVAVGVLSTEEAAAINDAVTVVGINIVPVGTAIVGVVGIVSGIAAHLATAFAARSKVVPVDSDAYAITPKAGA